MVNDIPKKRRSFTTGLISLVLAIIFFSGVFANVPYLEVLDFSTLSSTFPKWFNIQGLTGAKGGFLFAISLIPSVMLAIAALTIFEYFGALDVAEKLLSYITKPILGVPGVASIAIIASLQSTDAGAASTKVLEDEGKIKKKEVLNLAGFQFASGAFVTNFLGSFAPLLALTSVSEGNTVHVPISVGACLGIIFLFKLVAANIIRILIRKV